jgi:hypothetical protein
MATKTAVMGRFESHGEDFVHYVNASGKMMSSVDSFGTHYGSDFVMPDGTSMTGLQEQITAGVPNVIDTGTF